MDPTPPDQGKVGVYFGAELAGYGFGDDHPFGPDRASAFWNCFSESGLKARTRVLAPVRGQDADVLRFHTSAYLERVRRQSATDVRNTLPRQACPPSRRQSRRSRECGDELPS